MLSRTTSPGSSGMNWLTYDTMCATEQIMSEVLLACLGSPLTLSATASTRVKIARDRAAQVAASGADRVLRTPHLRRRRLRLGARGPCRARSR